MTKEEIAAAIASAIRDRDGKPILEIPLLEDGEQCAGEVNPFIPRQEGRGPEFEELLRKRAVEVERELEEQAKKKEQEPNPLIPGRLSPVTAGPSFVEDDPRFVCRDTPGGGRVCTRKDDE